MECSEVRLKLDEYLSGRLDYDISDQVSMHLKDCSRCFEELGVLKEINDILSLGERALPAADFTGKVMSFIEAEKDKKSFIPLRLSIINLGASLVLAGFFMMVANMPVVNSVLNRYASEVAYKTSSFNTTISTTTNNFHLYINSIIKPGGGLK